MVSGLYISLIVNKYFLETFILSLYLTSYNKNELYLHPLGL